VAAFDNASNDEIVDETCGTIDSWPNSKINRELGTDAVEPMTEKSSEVVLPQSAVLGR